MKLKVKILSAILVGIMGIGLTACGEGPQEKHDFTFGVATSSDRSLSKGLVKFGEILETETKGRFTVKVVANAALGNDSEVLKKVTAGTVTGTTVSTALLADYSKPIMVFDLPFLFKNSAQAYKVLDGQVGKDILDGLQKAGAGFVGLGYFENGFRHLTNGTRAVEKVADVEGLKIRTIKNDLHMSIWQTLGAEAKVIPFSELYNALSDKTVDGQENPLGNIVNMKFYDVQPYLTTTGHIYNASPLLISESAWKALSTRDKALVQKAAAEAIKYQRGLNAKEDEDALKLLQEKGMTMTDLSSEEKDSLMKKIEPLYKKYSTIDGADTLKNVREAKAK